MFWLLMTLLKFVHGLLVQYMYYLYQWLSGVYGTLLKAMLQVTCSTLIHLLCLLEACQHTLQVEGKLATAAR